MTDAERRAARERAWKEVRPGSAFEGLVMALGSAVGYTRKRAGGAQEGDIDDESDAADTVPSPETVEAACWPADIERALFCSSFDAGTLRRVLRFL
jgi:hypothetical protein